MQEYLDKIIEFWDSTNIYQQVTEVDAAGLFTNPWFMVPFVAMILYMIYKQGWKDLIIMSIFIGVWYASGTEYMNSLIVGGELQLEKVLPVAFGGAVLLGLVIYLLFGRSD